MSGIKSKREYDKFLKGEKLSRKGAMLAQCYVCNGGESEDCGGSKTCPMYQYFYYAVKQTNNDRAKVPVIGI